jgi:phosphinothricin acetyltransferase
MPILIRNVTPADIPSITAIYDHAVRHGTATFEIEPPDQAEMTRRMEALVGGGFPYLVAEEDGAVAGYAYAGPYRARVAYRFTVEDSIYLVPDRQRRGTGGQLLAALIAQSEKRGFRQMVAVIGDSANAGSVAVHQRAGFTMTGTLRAVGFKFGRWLDTVLMQRALGAGDTTTPRA